MLDQRGQTTGDERGEPAPGRDYAVAALLLVVVAAALLSPALRPGRILAPVDLIFDTPGYASEAPQGFDEPANPHLFDQTYQFVPWRHYAWQSLRDGRLPLWNPLSATGTPFVATMQAAVFYPLNLLTLPLPFAVTFAASALLRLWVAGFATYLLLRRYGCSHYAGLLSATSFMLSGFIVAWLGHPHTNVAIWLPALVLALEGLAGADAKLGALRWWPALALITGIQFLGGHIETSRDILLAGGAYFVFRLAQRRELDASGRARRLVAAGTGVMAGAGIAAIQLAPFIEWLPLSEEYRQRAGFEFDAWNVDLHPLLSLPLAIMPNLYGNPTWEGPYWSFNPWGSFNESVLYAGVIPLGLAVSALSGWRLDPVARCWSVIGGVCLLLALRVPVFDWFNQLPGNALSHPERLRLIAMFSVAVLAGRGLDRLTDAHANGVPQRWLMRFLLGVLTLTIGVAGLAGIGLKIDPDLGTDAVREAIARYDGSANPPRSVLVCRERIEECGQELADAFALANWRMYLPHFAAAAALAVIWTARRHPTIKARLAPALIAATALELLLTGLGFNPALPAEQLFPASAALETAIAERSTGRVTALQQDTLPDSHIPHGLSDVRGLDFKTARYERYLDASGDRIPWIANGVLLSDVGPLIAALDVQRVLTANPHIVEREVAEGSMTVVSNGDGLTVLEPVRYAERARMVYDVALAPDDGSVAQILAEDPQRVFERVILSDSAEAHRVQALLDGTDPGASVEPVTLEAERVAWNVQTDAPGILVVADAYFPGWTATVDGVPTEIMRANIALRAVYVPTGTHRVEMRYEPRSFRIGIAITALSTAIALGVLRMTYSPAVSKHIM